MPSEAIDVVGKMLDGFPNRSQAGDGYIGVLAKLLMEYPRSIALRCADPLHGVARETNFLPTIHNVTAWCDRESETLGYAAEWEAKAETQLLEREAWQSQPVNPNLLEKTKAWMDRRDPLAAKLSGVLDTDPAIRGEAEAKNSEQALVVACDRVASEWANRGEAPPRIAKLPISVELAGMLHERDLGSESNAHGTEASGATTSKPDPL